MAEVALDSLQVRAIAFRSDEGSVTTYVLVVGPFGSALFDPDQADSAAAMLRQYAQQARDEALRLAADPEVVDLTFAAAQGRA